jgi:hypothetical protein
MSELDRRRLELVNRAFRVSRRLEGKLVALATGTPSNLADLARLARDAAEITRDLERLGALCLEPFASPEPPSGRAAPRRDIIGGEIEEPPEKPEEPG